MPRQFKLDRNVILQHERVRFIDDLVSIHEHLNNLEAFMNKCFAETGFMPVQNGRVIALRATDAERLSSAFKSAIYLGKYKDMDNRNRFLKKMVAAGHSYEPIRGESILFIYIGVGKPVYDHLVTYTVGRPTRIAAGQRANLPWGFEAPTELRAGTDTFIEDGIDSVRNVVGMVKGLNELENRQQIQAARSLLPVGYIMPPFLLEFSEEALIKHVFAQRIFDQGAQGATVDVVQNMWDCVMQIDEEKWTQLFDYHGPHTNQWAKAMRTLRDKKVTMADLLDLAQESGLIKLDCEYDLNDIDIYEVLMATVGKMPPSMWDKKVM